MKKHSHSGKSTPIAILFIGIAFFISGILVSLLYQFQLISPTDDSVQMPLFRKLLSFSPILTLLIPVVFFPIVEEFTFRIWTIRKNYAYYITVIGIVLFSYFICKNIIFSIIVLLIFIALLWLKNPKVKIWSISIISSLLFGFLHVNNYTDISFTLIACSQLFGFGMILSYVGLRFNFAFCIVIHALYNLIAILPSLIGTDTERLSIEGESFYATIESISPFSISNNANINTNNTILMTGTPAEIAAGLNNFSKDTLYDYLIDGKLQKKRLQASGKTSESIDRKELLDSILALLHIQSITTVSPAYTLFIADSLKFYKSCYENSSGSALISFESLVESIRSTHYIPLIIEDEYDHATFGIDPNFFILKNREDMIQFLQKEHGLMITKKDSAKAVIIKYLQTQ
ncbi:CPBP family intramembrane metalloprotease [Bacteroidales bacterium OttesenSCG-928-L19]|nr:CPBP family intramembrane metalloprotease [Bacteroidales bacterium OttesenSCG-928-L19]